MTSHDELLEDRIIPWAGADDRVRGLAELGSRTHEEPADEWADMDLLLVVADTAPFLDSDAWIDDIAPHWLALRHPGPFPGVPVRQVLFTGALDFDIVPITAGTVADRIAEPHLAELFGGGFRPLVDKDGELASIEIPRHPPPLSTDDVTRSEFDFVVSDFLFQTVWAAKHLRRGELWAAKDDVDCYMKADLAGMIEWHTVATRPGTRTRGGGRYLERWADDRIVGALPASFAAYEPASVAAALIEMAALFRRVASETAGLLGYTYPDAAHDAVMRWVGECLSVYE